MTIDQLMTLARAGQLSEQQQVACIECIEAAKEMNKSWRNGEGGKAQRIAFDAALARLEQEQER